jgi:transcriptional regulator GlxA family with amidase domain
MRQRVIFHVLPQVEILDLAGPLQAFHSANLFGAGFEVRICSPEPRIQSDQGLWLSDLEPPPDDVDEDDLVIVPGGSFKVMSRVDPKVSAWIRRAYERGAYVTSVCTGAFALASAGLLDERQCTTHWARVDDLKRLAPRARVLTNRLFVEDGRVTTSAGIASGIDMALAFVDRRYGPVVTSATARELVVYLRRDGAHGQQSVYLDYRTHLNPGVHRVQDWLVAHPAERATQEELARVAGMSVRNLTRVFRQATGISILEFATKVRLELARTLLADPGLTIDAVAERCGFDTAAHLRRLWKREFGAPPSASRPSRA